MSLARAIVSELAGDPEALAELRALLGVADVSDTAPAVYSVATLARTLGRSERSIRAAIGRGELEAVKRGRGWVVSADAVERWARAPRENGRAPAAPRGRVMARALSPRPGPVRASRP